MYTIHRTQFEYNAVGDPCLTRDELLPGSYSNHRKANSKIKGYAEAWRRESTMIQHHAGQSVVFFPGYYVEFTRNALNNS